MSNFSLSEQHKIKVLLLWITVLGQSSIALYLPSFPAIAHSLAISSVEVKQTITTFIIGFGISPIFYGPFSDIYGRKPILLFSLCLSCAGYIINIFSDTIHLFLIARVLQGLGCGGLLIAGRSIVRDVFSGRELSSASSYLSMGFSIGFGVSPIIGGYLATYFVWKASFIFLVIMTTIIFLTILFLLPETLKRKEIYSFPKVLFLNTISDYRMILQNKKFIKFLISGFFAYGIVMTYNVMTPFLMQRTFHLSSIHYSYLALLVGGAYYFAASYNKKLVLKWGVYPIFSVGYGLIIFSGIIMLSLNFLLNPNLFYIVPLIMISVFGQALIFSNTISCALQQFSSSLAGKVSALLSSIQMILVSFFAAIIALLPYKTAMPIAVIIVILGVGCAVVLFRNDNND